MLRLFITRLSLLIPTFFGVTIVTFGMIRLIPGDPVEIMAGERGLSPERHAETLAKLGLDRSLPVQYFDYITDILRGDLGNSLITHTAVLREFLTLFPATLELSFCAIVFAVVLGIPAGMLAGIYRGRLPDFTVMAVSLGGYSMPIFWWALLMILLFSNTLGWTPVSGRISVYYYFEPVTGFMLIDSLLSGQKGAFGSAVSHLILPTIVLGTIPLAVIGRMTRSSMLEVLSEDYIRTARAKGVSPFQVVTVHALRNALIPVVTVIGLQVSVLLTGAILTETIFAWPGIGKWIIHGVNSRDWPVLQGGVLIIAVIIMFVNLAVDLTYGVLNPRIRYQK